MTVKRHSRDAKLGEPNPARQEELATCLNELGVALNYGHDPRLRDTAVLRPDRLTNRIYGILRANDKRWESSLVRERIATPESLERIYNAA
jgi:hypothetical protein